MAPESKIIANTTVSNPFKEHVLEDMNEREEKAKAMVAQKQAEYDAAMAKMNVFQAQKDVAIRRLNAAVASNKSEAESIFSKASSNLFNAESTVEALRGSLLSNLFYYSKTCNTSYLAQSMLG